MKNLFINLIVVSSIFVLLTACTGRLAKYQLPTIIDNVQIDRSSTIRYRILTKQDFKSTNPEKIKTQYKHFAALSRIYISLDESKLNRNIEIKKSDSGQTVITLTDPGYHALFDQKKSWFNKNSKTLPPDYVLQHEQIHFSIMELEARRMNHKRKYNPISVSASSPEKAIHKFAEKIKSDLTTTLELAHKQNLKFDIQTSGRHLPKTQSRWMEEIWKDFNKLL